MLDRRVRRTRRLPLITRIDTWCTRQARAIWHDWTRWTLVIRIPVIPAALVMVGIGLALLCSGIMQINF